LSHRGTSSKADLVKAVEGCGLKPFVFLDCLTKPWAGFNNELFLWQNLWASHIFVRVDSPDFESSKWCMKEVAAFELIMSINVESQLQLSERKMEKWDWHAFPLCSAEASLYFSWKLAKLWTTFTFQMKDVFDSLYLEQALQRQVLEVGPNATEEEIKSTLIILSHIWPPSENAFFHNLARDLILKLKVSQECVIATQLIQRLKSLKDILSLITVDFSELSITWLFECCIRGTPVAFPEYSDLRFKGKIEVIEHDNCFSFLTQDPELEPSWILATLPMHQACYIAQLRNKLVVDRIVNGFSLSQIPCLTVDNVSELSSLMKNPSQDRRNQKWIFQKTIEGFPETILEPGPFLQKKEKKRKIEKSNP
jgi:hypothetical protein